MDEGARFRVNIRTNGVFSVKTKANSFIAKTIVLSTGSTYRLLGIPNETELIGSGIHFCATCDGAFYRDKDIIVIGGGNSALEEGIFQVKNIKKNQKDSPSQSQFKNT